MTAALVTEHSFHWDDENMGDHGVWVVGLRQPHLPQPRVHIENLSQADGAVGWSASVGPRRFRAECVLAGSSAADRETKLAAFITAMEKTKTGEQTLTWHVYPTREYSAFLASGIDAETWLASELFTLEFICPDPSYTTIGSVI